MSCASNRTVFPRSTLLRPTEDLEINGDETLSLEYSARDDFGIGEIALITKVGDREEKISLQKRMPSGSSCATSMRGISASSACATAKKRYSSSGLR